jgi:serine/threonine-protein kinase HipA
VKVKHVTQVAVFHEPHEGRRNKVGRLALRSRRIYFEYDPAFIATNLQLSPFKLPLRAGLFEGEPTKLEALMGVFDDSLPDGWGRLLIDRRAVELGLSASSLTPLDRLTLVGSRSMGALFYEPEVAVEAPQIVELAELVKDVEIVLDDGNGADLEKLIAVGGSPMGARPKALVQIGPRGEVWFGALRIQPGFTAWLVKFPSRSDDPNVAALEHAYFLMARRAGLHVPRTQVLGRTKKRHGFFAIERFDRSGTTRTHCHTLGGLLHLPHGYPALDYRDLLQVTRDLTRDQSAVTEMFRRACFNVLAHNRDDHSRNFAFLMDERGAWAPSPAYDLTFAHGPGGEHTMLVAGEGRFPGVAHLQALAKGAGVKRSADIIDQVREATSDFASFADEARVPATLRSRVATALKST